jgi:hypothetical protein
VTGRLCMGLVYAVWVFVVLAVLVSALVAVAAS